MSRAINSLILSSYLSFMKNFYRSGIIIFHFFLSVAAFATHNRAGEITFRQIDALTYEFTLTTITDISNPQNADRPAADLNFGDNSSANALRSNGPVNPSGQHMGEVLANAPNFKKNIYIFTHTFPGQGSYVVSYADQNRNDGVLNMLHSVSTAFYVETYLVINPFIGFDSSPVLTLDPIDFGGLHKLFVHNPGAHDPDGDSLSYKLVTCKQAVNKDVYGFKPLSNFASDYATIDPYTGEFVWKTPAKAGLYNLAILIEEWRYVPKKHKYIKIGSVTRDMQIQIVDTDNNPPIITQPADVCVLAGKVIAENIIAEDEDNDLITLTAAGGPFKVSPAAEFVQGQTRRGIITIPFKWQPTCDLVRKQPYQVVFKAVDDGNPNLVDLKPWSIRVIAPPPTNLTTLPLAQGIRLTWDKADCEGALGYFIYRKVEHSSFVPTVCESGIPPEAGYELIDSTSGINTTIYMDDNHGSGLSVGNLYCYRVLAYYPDGSLSLCSDEACNILKRDRPSITHVSILSTSMTTGSDSVIWTNPTELDTSQNHPPYTYKLFRRSSSNSAFVQLATYTSNTIQGWTDTVYKENNLNTFNDQFTYRVDLYAHDGDNVEYLAGSSNTASSVFLRGVPHDRSVVLSFNNDVPWNIDSTQIFRFDDGQNKFVRKGVAKGSAYLDRDGLINKISYRYYVRRFGHYSGSGFASPLINNSQEISITPIDTTPPCIPVLDSVSPDCNQFKNSLQWELLFDTCAADMKKFLIYRSTSREGSFELVDSILFSESPNDSYIDERPELKESIAGCYFLTAVDSSGNESGPSKIICVDNCPAFKLPNVFTPNSDGINDLFIPIPDSSKFNQSIDLIIFNRWGGIVFKTKDPKINWNGTHYLTGEMLPAGVYFYTCDIFEHYLDGIKKRTITGNITLLKKN